MEVLLVVLALELLLAPDGEHVVVEADIDVLLADAGQLRRDADLLVRLRHVHAGIDEGADVALALAAGRGGQTGAAEDIVEEAVHLAMKREEGITGKHSAAGTEGDHGIAGHRAVLLIRCGIRGGAIVRRGRVLRLDTWAGVRAGRRRLTRYGTSRHRDQPAPGRAQAAKD